VLYEGLIAEERGELLTRIEQKLQKFENKENTLV
jgi:hypothetical protein